jgi:hypothetical protein
MMANCCCIRIGIVEDHGLLCFLGFVPADAYLHKGEMLAGFRALAVLRTEDKYHGRSEDGTLVENESD